MAGLIAASNVAQATVTIVSFQPSLTSPQPVGTPITWTAIATDTNPNGLTFQFNVAYVKKPFGLARDFNIGTFASGIWQSQPFIWATIYGEGVYTIQVIAKDFTSGETATQTAKFTLSTRIVNGAPAVSPTANSLVALFSAPPCAAGSFIRVAFYTVPGAIRHTGWATCNPVRSTNFYVAGMYASTTYTMYSQVKTGNTIVNGSNVSFTTGVVPVSLPPPNIVPKFTLDVAPGPNTDSLDSTLLWAFKQNTIPVATDLAGKIIWYYAVGGNTVVLRPLPGGNMMIDQDGLSWASSDTIEQLLREIDLAGNTVRETNTGVISQQLLAMGAIDAVPCGQVPKPAPVGTACLNDFHHDAIRFYVGGNQYTAFLAHLEKLFPPGTQGSDPSGPPVDLISEILIVLNSQWQVVWYWDTFQHLDVNRASILPEVCIPAQGCPVNLQLSTQANDWTHGNSLYYISSSGDFLFSLRAQDWVIKIDYNNGAGTGNVLWRLGQGGDFTFNNIYNDPWPWFSYQHDAGYENNGAGPLTIFDNGNARLAAPPIGLGSNCGPNDCFSRGMALTIDETLMQATPVLSADLGVFGGSLGSAQLLSNGNYFFLSGAPASYSIQIFPTPGTDTGTQVLKVSSPYQCYRAWQMADLYTAPTT